MIRLHGVSKRYVTPAGEVTALAPTTLDARRGEFVWLSGPSGAGKSTLLGIAALLVVPDTGEVLVDEKRMDKADDRVRTAFRAEALGFVPQSPRLFLELTVAQNVSLAVPQARAARVVRVLDRVGIGRHHDSLVKTLSGGEQQRVSVARALLSRPWAVLADEPSSGLDDDSAAAVFAVLRGLADDDRCVVVASHDARIAPYVHRRVAVRAPGTAATP